MHNARIFSIIGGMNKPAIHQIIDAIGADHLCQRFGVSAHALRFARFKGEFSGSWYAPLKEMCDAGGIDCPLDAFIWKDVQDAPAPVQQEGAA